MKKKIRIIGFAIILTSLLVLGLKFGDFLNPAKEISGIENWFNGIIFKFTLNIDALLLFLPIGIICLNPERHVNKLVALRARTFKILLSLFVLIRALNTVDNAILNILNMTLLSLVLLIGFVIGPFSNKESEELSDHIFYELYREKDALKPLSKERINSIKWAKKLFN